MGETTFSIHGRGDDLLNPHFAGLCLHWIRCLEGLATKSDECRKDGICRQR